MGENVWLLSVTEQHIPCPDACRTWQGERQTLVVGCALRTFEDDSDLKIRAVLPQLGG